jgi:hypothetical protein
MAGELLRTGAAAAIADGRIHTPDHCSRLPDRPRAATDHTAAQALVAGQCGTLPGRHWVHRHHPPPLLRCPTPHRGSLSVSNGISWSHRGWLGGRGLSTASRVSPPAPFSHRRRAGGSDRGRAARAGGAPRRVCTGAIRNLHSRRARSGGGKPQPHPPPRRGTLAAHRPPVCAPSPLHCESGREACPTLTHRLWCALSGGCCGPPCQ